MTYPYQPWRARLQPASFAGCGFHVEVGVQSGGRRIAEHEYPKVDTPFGEDMGRKARRWQITAYVIGPDYLDGRDALIAACEAEGPSALIHPSLGEKIVHCDSYAVAESREQGGKAQLDLVFVEAGQNPDASATADTQAQATSAADTSNGAAAATVDGGLAGQGGIGSDAVASAQAAANITPVTTPTASVNDGFGGPSAPINYPGGVRGIGSA